MKTVSEVIEQARCFWINVDQLGEVPDLIYNSKNDTPGFVLVIEASPVLAKIANLESWNEELQRLCSVKDEEIKTVLAEIKRLKAVLHIQTSGMETEINFIIKERDSLKEAIEFYADKENWREDDDRVVCGKRAREALKKTKTTD